MDNLRGGFAFSIGFHALVLALIIFGLPFLKPAKRELPPMISVELVQIGKETTTNRVSPAQKVVKEPADEPPPEPAKPPPTPEQEQPAPEPPTPEPPKPETREPLDQSAPKLATVKSDAPQLATPHVDLKPNLAPAPPLAEIDDSAPKLPAPQQANLRPRLAAAPELAAVDDKTPTLAVPAKIDLKRPAPAFNVDSVLKNLSKVKPQAASDQPTDDKPVKTAAKPSGAQAPISSQLTASELSALGRQLGNCWSLPDLAKDARNMTADIDITVNPDRTVASVQVEDQGRMASDPVFRAFAMSAVRALRVPQCQHLELPPEKYQEWQSMTIHFDPKEMLGQ